MTGYSSVAAESFCSSNKGGDNIAGRCEYVVDKSGERDGSGEGDGDGDGGGQAGDT